MSNPISDFYDVIWTFRRGQETIDALYSGELSLDAYAEMLYDKRRAYDACVLECCINKRDGYDLPFFYGRLKPQLESYSNYDFNKEVEKDTRAYWALEYHKVRFKELSVAIKNTKDLMHSYGVKFSGYFIVEDTEGTDKTIRIGNNYYYTQSYTDEQLELIYQRLLYRYLDSDTKLEDFKYYITGRGNNIPDNGMNWLKGKDELAYFIDTFCPCRNKYVIAEKIFSESRLASAVYQSKKENPFKELKKEVDKMRKLGK